MSDRKYRQPGYQDRGRETSEKREPPRPKDSLEGPRAMQMPGTRSVSRCAQCGTVLPAMVENLAQCPKCGAALHTCKQCTYFDPGSRFECRQPVPERVARKDAANNYLLLDEGHGGKRNVRGCGSRRRCAQGLRKPVQEIAYFPSEASEDPARARK